MGHHCQHCLVPGTPGNPLLTIIPTNCPALTFYICTHCWCEVWTKK